MLPASFSSLDWEGGVAKVADEIMGYCLSAESPLCHDNCNWLKWLLEIRTWQFGWK